MFGVRWTHALIGVLTLVIAAGVAGLAWLEMESSTLQSAFFNKIGRQYTFRVEPGPADFLRYPSEGPYDERLGYTQLPSFLKRMTAGDYRIEAQARQSEPLRQYMELGGFAPYAEKTSGGLTILDRTGVTLFSARYPERTFDGYASVPKLIADTLLFIENRELLDGAQPLRNPAVEWDRFGMALLSMPLQSIRPETQRVGGSTLATQIEKYRHSPGGQTSGGLDKLRQMVSASVRAYQDGYDTTQARRRILVDYLNSTPLSARPGLGEINGLGDGLWAWYGTDFATANRILINPVKDETALARQAIVYKQVLSLLLAQRRPSYYLAQDRDALEDLANEHLRVLEKAGVIPAALADASRNFRLVFRPEAPVPAEQSFVEQKAVNAIRSRLLSMLGVRSLYELDRVDATVETTLDQAAQQRVTKTLESLADPEALRDFGLMGDRLLDRGDPARVVYSVTLYERSKEANRVRVQVDTLDQPLDLNEGAKLDLGSTAKLRTLITYLEIVENQYRRLHRKPHHELEAIALDAQDRMVQWTARTLAAEGDIGLPALLERAMERSFSASPAERFFTGGGVHTFANFDDKDDGRVMTVSEAFRNSVNLVFIRMMREVVNHYIAEGPTSRDDVLDDPSHPARQQYLAKFADQEGRQFLNQYWVQYKDLTPDQALDHLARRSRGGEDRLAALFRTVRPEASAVDLGRFLARQSGARARPPAAVEALYKKFDPASWSLNDRGYLVGVSPLELWLVAYLQTSPDRARKAMLRDSRELRQEAYKWLFAASHQGAQNTRISIMLEEEAFSRLHASWKRLGYPFESLVSSYATAIGSSADRPGALADLMGVIVNDGLRVPTARVTRLHFAAGTPYEVKVALDESEPGERVMAPDIARTVRRHLMDIVENGTARRVKGAFVAADGSALSIGGKTGTGDHRFERFGPGGVVLESRVVNRTATFVFYIGDRHFGVITAHVHGPEAANYKFTSALPAQLLKALAPALRPLINEQIPQTASTSAGGSGGNNVRPVVAPPAAPKPALLPAAGRPRDTLGNLAAPINDRPAPVAAPAAPAL